MIAGGQIRARKTYLDYGPDHNVALRTLRAM
jgi:hypothetical protein